MNYLIFDTETSGLPLFNLPPGAPEQPVILQIAAILLDNSFNEVATLNTLVNHGRDVEIHPKAFEAHGLSNGLCRTTGLLYATMTDKFMAMYNTYETTFVAHNLKFDIFLWRCHLARYQEHENLFFARHTFCTMEAMTPICKIRNKWRPDYKWPKLQEAFYHIMGHEFDDAHDALADVRACAEVFKYLRRAPAARPPAPLLPVAPRPSPSVAPAQTQSALC